MTIFYPFVLENVQGLTRKFHVRYCCLISNEAGHGFLRHIVTQSCGVFSIIGSLVLHIIVPASKTN
jgi:hypothetical protein